MQRFSFVHKKVRKPFLLRWMFICTIIFTIKRKRKETKKMYLNIETNNVIV